MSASPPAKWTFFSCPVPQPAGHAIAPAAVTLRQEKLLNRDLSWLAFNERVLGEAADASVPPLERLRFATIVSSNLDEFFMVRVAEIAGIARRFPARRFPDGLTASQVLGQIREAVLRQKARQAAILGGILDSLRLNGIRIYTRFGGDAALKRDGRPGAASAEKASALDREIQARLPAVKFILHRSTDAIPALMSERIHVFVRFPGEYAIMTIQDREERLIRLPSSARSQRYALAERWLCAKAPELFPGREVIEAFPFKIIREADLRYRPDDEQSLEDQIVEAVARRSKAKVVRLEVDAPSYSEGVLFLAAGLRLDSASLYRFDLPLDLRALARTYHAKVSRRMRYPRVRPHTPNPFRRRERFFDILRRRDILLHHPYDSFDIVVDFVRQAAEDPQVERIYHTMYRTSAQSPVMQALMRAAKNGKKVTAYVEIKARFDELNNVRWADELRRAGVRVVRPLGGHKVHSKVTQVLRREGEEEVSYLHLGTGNYHPATARQYTDLGLLTADAQMGREVSAYFGSLARRAPPTGLRDLLVAPKNLHSQILRLIHEETRIQQAGGRGHIIGKMNSLVDPDIIEALYAASRAGVKVELLVRGICCLRPGIRGLSENIRVESVVDRFLEHSRIYYFRAGGAELTYLSSADWMPRNFYTRFEIAFPVKDPVLRKYIREVVLANGLADNVKSWTLRPDGNYQKTSLAKTGKTVRSQLVFEELARKHYRDTLLDHRIRRRPAESPAEASAASGLAVVAGARPKARPRRNGDTCPTAPGEDRSAWRPPRRTPAARLNA